MAFKKFPRKRVPKRRRLGAASGVATALRIGRKVAKYAPRVAKVYNAYKKMNQRISPDGNGSSFSSFMQKWKPLGMAKRILSSNTCQRYMTMATACMTATVGLQVAYPFDVTQNGSLQNILTRIQTALSVGVVAPNNQLGTVGTNGFVINTTVYALKEVKNIVTFTNNTNTTCFLDLYEYAAREDGSTGALTAFTQGINDSTGNAIGSGAIYVTPFQSSEFCTLFKILSVKHIELSAGRTHKHSSVFYPNVEINAERIVVGSYMRGVGRGFMAVAYGVPCDSGNQTVGLSAVQLDCIQQKEYLFGYGVNNAKLFQYQASGLNTTLQKTENLGSGIAEIFTIA